MWYQWCYHIQNIRCDKITDFTGDLSHVSPAWWLLNIMSLMAVAYIRWWRGSYDVNGLQPMHFVVESMKKFSSECLLTLVTDTKGTSLVSASLRLFLGVYILCIYHEQYMKTKWVTCSQPRGLGWMRLMWPSTQAGLMTLLSRNQRKDALIMPKRFPISTCLSPMFTLIWRVVFIYI